MITVAHTCSALLIAIGNIDTVCEIGLYLIPPQHYAPTGGYGALYLYLYL